MALIKKRVFIQTSEAVTDTDGFPKTDLYFDGYNQQTNSVKGYLKSGDEEGEEVFNEVLELKNDIVKEVIEY